MRSKIRDRKSEIGGAALDVALARRLLTEVLADEARHIGWGPDVTNLGKLRDALAALGREVPRAGSPLESLEVVPLATAVAPASVRLSCPAGQKGGR